MIFNVQMPDHPIVADRIWIAPKMKTMNGAIRYWAVLAGACLLQTGSVQADDWPQWMGPQRDAVWREQGIVETFPTNGPIVRWRVAVERGYCGPAVVADKLYMMDRIPGPKYERKPGDKTIPALAGNERVLCLNANTGEKIWQHEYDCPYRIGYPSGPRATPVVAAGKVFTLGAMGDLLCLNSVKGGVVWERHLLKDYALEPPTWGFAVHPLLDGDRLICMVGGSNTVVVAFDKNTGKELWTALTAQEIGYAPPAIHTINGKRHLIIWHPEAISGLDPETGKLLWTRKYPIEGKLQRPEVTIASPRVSGNKIFVTSFYHGATLLQISGDPPTANVLWNRHSSSESELNDGLHTTMSTPVFKNDYIYGICGGGELRCLSAKNGDRVWENTTAVGKPGLFASAFFIENGDRFFIWNDQGELIIARLTPKSFEEISRAKLLETSENTRGRDIVWCHPAFANRCAYMHNGKELICVSLAKEVKS